MADRFFVMKPAKVQQLQEAIDSGVWAFPVRKSEPQLYDQLAEAWDSTRLAGTDVILLFSANRSKRWAGYAKLLERPQGPDVAVEEAKEDGTPSTALCKPFRIQWLRKTRNPMSKGLPSSACAALKNDLAEGQLVNLSRNGQEVVAASAARLCALMRSCFEQEEAEAAPPPVPPPLFLLEEGEEAHAGFTRLTDMVARERGRVLFAAAYGSRRYNLHSADSDTDMLVVYQAPLVDVLSRDSARAVVKNDNSYDTDVTLAELAGFIDKLEGGDVHMVEALFQTGDDAVLIDGASSPVWQQLKALRHRLVTRRLVKHAVSEARGRKGLRSLRTAEELLPALAFKRWAIVLRLLETALYALQHHTMRTWLDDDHPLRRRLLDVRAGVFTHAECQAQANALLEAIETEKQSSLLPECCDVKAELNNLLLRARLGEGAAELRLPPQPLTAVGRRPNSHELHAAAKAVNELDGIGRLLFAGLQGNALYGTVGLPSRDTPIQLLVMSSNHGAARLVESLYSSALKLARAHADQSMRAEPVESPYRAHVRRAGADERLVTVDGVRFFITIRDASDYADLLRNGNPGVLESMFLPAEYILASSAEWQALRDLFPDRTALYTARAVKGYAGQAAAIVKQQAGRRDLTPVQRRCLWFDACRLLSCARLMVAGESLVYSLPEAAASMVITEESKAADLSAIGDEEDALPPIGSASYMLALLAGERGYTGLSDAVMAGADEIMKQPRKPKMLPLPPLQAWVDSVRASDTPLPARVVSDEPFNAAGDAPLEESTAKLLRTLTFPKPHGNVLFVARSGSYMYDLHTARSDEDYFIIYADSLADLRCMRPPKPLCSGHPPSKFGEDKAGVMEYEACEIAFFLTLLMKGNPRNIEPLFSDRNLFVAPLWAELCAIRHLFLTERLIDHYFGYVHDRLHRVAKQDGEHAKAKLFYHAFHKLTDLKRLLRGEEPMVTAVGERRDFILRIRAGPWEGDFSPDALMERARAEVSEADVLRAARKQRLPAEVDVDALAEWLMSVRERGP
eukprot:PLAT5636.1.p1 GENE.PLAT5636.1~~PLAT5636.1.p1  ORF type:complete len:1038 (+),score=353.76 PLAT5636.1:39-3116(+)